MEGDYNSRSAGHIESTSSTLAWVWFERFLCLLVLAGFAHTMLEFMRIGKLPQPFIFDINDTFMDWFNTSFFGRQRSTYSSWQSIYPPLSFAFLDLVGIPRCYQNDPFQARDCDVLGQFIILLIYFGGAFTAYLSFRRAKLGNSTARGIAFMFGLPLLFTLERGNLILLCLIFFALYFGNLVKNQLARAVLISLNVNFKPYLLIPVLALLIQRKWRKFEVIGVFCLIVYLLSFSLIGKGSPAEIAVNVGSFTVLKGGLIYEDFFYSTSFAPFLELNTWRVPGRDFIDGRFIEAAAVAIPLLIRTSQIIIFAIIIGAWLQPRCLSEARLALLLLGAALITQSPGGYTMTFIVFLVFLEKPTSGWVKFSVFMAYLLCIPYDYVFSQFIELQGQNWVSGRSLTFPIGPSVGMFVRPLLIILMIWSIAFDSLIAIWRAHRVHRPSLWLMPSTRPMTA